MLTNKSVLYQHEISSCFCLQITKPLKENCGFSVLSFNGEPHLQWRANSILDLNPASYSLDKENWGWSWKERWIAARPWEIRANTHPTIPKKVQTKQRSKLNEITYQPGSKVSTSANHSLSNKGSSKARNSSMPK